MISPVALDATDKEILRVLQERGRIPNTELADEVGLTPAPCLRRVKRLEDLGVIGGYTARVNPAAVGKTLMVFVTVTLDRQNKSTYDDFAATMRKHNEVLECYLMLGERDFFLKVIANDLEAYQRFYLDVLTSAKGVRNVVSSIVVREEKNSSVLVLP